MVSIRWKPNLVMRGLVVRIRIVAVIMPRKSFVKDSDFAIAKTLSTDQTPRE